MTENVSLAIDQLTDYEMMIASHLVDPHDISISWEDIAGLENVIQELRETVILPIQRKELFADSQLTQAPKVWRCANIQAAKTLNVRYYLFKGCAASRPARMW